MFKNGIAYAAVFAGGITFTTLYSYVSGIIAAAAAVVVFLLIAGSDNNKEEISL